MGEKGNLGLQDKQEVINVVPVDLLALGPVVTGAP